MTKQQRLSIVLTMIVSFAATFAIASWQRRAAELASQTAIAPPTAEPMPRSRPAPIEPSEPVIAPRPVSAQAAMIAAPAAGAPPAEPLPVSVRLWNRHGRHIIELDATNNSSNPLDLSVQVESASEHRTSSTSIHLEPGQQKSFGEADGLDMHGEDQVTLHGAGYRDWVGQVPP